MKKTWQPEELVEYWTLLPEELALLNQKNDENRLGFAILLKFFEIYARFPENNQEISKNVVDYVAKLLDISPQKYSYYDWQGRSLKKAEGRGQRAEGTIGWGFRPQPIVSTV
jgi:hypothetical protein